MYISIREREEEAKSHLEFLQLQWQGKNFGGKKFATLVQKWPPSPTDDPAKTSCTINDEKLVVAWTNPLGDEFCNFFFFESRNID